MQKAPQDPRASEPTRALKVTLKQDDLANLLIDQLGERRWQVASAESCSAGRIGQKLAAAKGASKTYAGGVIAYTKETKNRVLGVPAELMSRPEGAVSEEVAIAMAEGVLQLTGVAIAVATTGVAGPSPDEDGNPVGRIVVAIARAGRKSEAQRFDYGECACDDILNWTVDAALMMLARHLAAAPE